MSHERGDVIACIDLVELVTDYLEGALGAEEADTFEAHMSTCDGCRVYVEQIRETRERLGRVPPDPAGGLPEAARQELLAAFREESPR
jgi:anti-sigma factor RsiW